MVLKYPISNEIVRYDKTVEQDLCSQNKSNFSKGVVSLTFDDGWREIYTNGIPILEKANIKSTQFISTRVVENGQNKYVSAAEILDMAKKGHEIASHSMDHRYFSEISESEILPQLIRSKNYLQYIGVSNVDTFSYPYGKKTEYSHNLIRESSLYSAVRGTNPGLNDRNSDPLSLNSYVLQNSMHFSPYIKNLVDDATRNNKWLILVFHQIARPNYQYYTAPEDLQNLVDYLILMKVPVLTVRDVVSHCIVKK